MAVRCEDRHAGAAPAGRPRRRPPHGGHCWGKPSAKRSATASAWTARSAKTRIEVVTEGILIRLLQRDPALEGIGAVLFDEFHERSLDADLGLALCLQTQSVLRDDLRLLVMSATLDGTAVARLLDDAPSSRRKAGPSRSKPATSTHPARAGSRMPWHPPCCGRLMRKPATSWSSCPASRKSAGGKLLAQASTGPGILIAPLYGDLPQDRQDAAIGPTPPGCARSCWRPPSPRPA